MRNRQLFLATMAFAIAFSVWGLIGALGPRFKDLYHLSDTQAAVAVAVPVILGSLFRIPLGILADRFGGRLVFSLLLAFAIVPAAGIALVHSYTALLIGGFFLGVVGAGFAVGVSFSARWFPPERQGLALGIFGAGNIGQSIAVFFAPRLAKVIAWETVFWIFGAFSLAWAVVFWLFARDATAGTPGAMGQIAQVFLRKRMSWLLSFFYFITFGGFVAMGVYLPTLLKNHFHLTLEDAGLRTAGFVVLATALRPVGGWIADRIGGPRLLAPVFALIACLALLLTSSDFVIFSLGALGIAALLGLGNGAVFKLVPRYFPGEIGAATGLVGAIGGLGGFFPPIVLGVLKQTTGSYTIGFVLLALFALAALVLDVVVLLRPARRQAPMGAVRSAS